MMGIEGCALLEKYSFLDIEGMENNDIENFLNINHYPIQERNTDILMILHLLNEYNMLEEETQSLVNNPHFSQLYLTDDDDLFIHLEKIYIYQFDTIYRYQGIKLLLEDLNWRSVQRILFHLLIFLDFETLINLYQTCSTFYRKFNQTEILCRLVQHYQITDSIISFTELVDAHDRKFPTHRLNRYSIRFYGINRSLDWAVRDSNDYVFYYLLNNYSIDKPEYAFSRSIKIGNNKYLRRLLFLAHLLPKNLIYKAMQITVEQNNVIGLRLLLAIPGLNLDIINERIVYGVVVSGNISLLSKREISKKIYLNAVKNAALHNTLHNIANIEASDSGESLILQEYLLAIATGRLYNNSKLPSLLLNDVPDQYLKEWITIAVQTGNIELFQSLNPNMQNLECSQEFYYRLAIIAAKYGHLDLLQILMKNITNIHFNVIVAIQVVAVQNNHIEILEYLLTNKNYYNQIAKYAVIYDQYDCLRWAIEHGAKISKEYLPKTHSEQRRESHCIIS